MRRGCAASTWHGDGLGLQVGFGTGMGCRNTCGGDGNNPWGCWWPKILLWSHPRSSSFRMSPKPLRFSCGHFLAGVRINPTQNGHTGVTGCSGHPRVDYTLHGYLGIPGLWISTVFNLKTCILGEELPRSSCATTMRDRAAPSQALLPKTCWEYQP